VHLPAPLQGTACGLRAVSDLVSSHSPPHRAPHSPALKSIRVGHDIVTSTHGALNSAVSANVVVAASAPAHVVYAYALHRSYNSKQLLAHRDSKRRAGMLHAEEVTLMRRGWLQGQDQGKLSLWSD